MVDNISSRTITDITGLVNMTTAPPDTTDQNIGLLVVLVCMCVVIFILNIALCTAIFYYTTLHRMVFFYAASAAISDCLRVALVMSLTTVRIITGHWQVDLSVCNGWYYLHIFFVTNTLCHMGFMSAHVYFTIKDPIKTKLSNQTLKNCFRILRTWLTAAATTGIPYLIFHTTQIGAPIQFLGCGRETFEYIVCSTGLCILLPVIVLTIIDVASSVAICKKTRLIHHLQSRGKKEQMTDSSSNGQLVGERFVRLGSFYSVGGNKHHKKNTGQECTNQIIQINITDPDENTTTYLTASLKGHDNPTFSLDEGKTQTSNKSNDTDNARVKVSNQSVKITSNHVELKVLNGQLHTGGENQEEAHILLHAAPTDNNNIATQPITNQSATETPPSERNSPSTHTASDNSKGETSKHNQSNSGPQIAASDKNENSQSYMDQVHQEQFLRISTRLAHIHIITLLTILLFISFMTLNLPFYVTYVLYALCTTCRLSITPVLVWIFQWLSFGTSLIHPLFTLIVVIRVRRAQ